MQPDCFNPDEVIEVVYLPEVSSMTREEERALLERVEKLEGESRTTKLLKVLKNWTGPTASLVVVVGALIAGLHYFVKPDLTALSANVSALQTDVSRIQADLAKAGE